MIFDIEKRCLFGELELGQIFKCSSFIDKTFRKIYKISYTDYRNCNVVYWSDDNPNYLIIGLLHDHFYTYPQKV